MGEASEPRASVRQTGVPILWPDRPSAGRMARSRECQRLLFLPCDCYRISAAGQLVVFLLVVRLPDLPSALDSILWRHASPAVRSLFRRPADPELRRSGITDCLPEGPSGAIRVWRTRLMPWVRL